MNAADAEQLRRWSLHLPGPGSRALGQKDFLYVLAIETRIFKKIILRLANYQGRL